MRYHAAKSLNVPRSTLHFRVKGRQSRSHSNAVQQALIPEEESELLRGITMLTIASRKSPEQRLMHLLIFANRNRRVWRWGDASMHRYITIKYTPHPILHVFNCARPETTPQECMPRISVLAFCSSCVEFKTMPSAILNKLNILIDVGIIPWKA